MVQKIRGAKFGATSRCFLAGGVSSSMRAASKPIPQLFSSGKVPCAERVVFNSTGTEAVQVAFRLARAFTVLTGYCPSVREGDGRPICPTELTGPVCPQAD